MVCGVMEVGVKIMGESVGCARSVAGRRGWGYTLGELGPGCRAEGQCRTAICDVRWIMERWCNGMGTVAWRRRHQGRGLIESEDGSE